VLLKDRAVGVTLTAGVIRVPVGATICGLVESESVIVSVPVSTPVEVGRNLTLMRQLLPGARLVPQVVLSEKLPLHAKLMPVTVVVPTFAQCYRLSEHE
jgi:hypothetical protein